MKNPTLKEKILSHLYQNPYCDVREIAAAVGHDPGLTRVYLAGLKGKGFLVSRGARCSEFRLSDREFHRRTSLEAQDALMGCPLCTLERKTKWWHEDDVCVVCDCLTCGVPMIVLKRHAPEPTPYQERHMRRVVARLGMVTTREKMREIPAHCHWHLKHGGER